MEKLYEVLQYFYNDERNPYCLDLKFSKANFSIVSKVGEVSNIANLSTDKTEYKIPVEKHDFGLFYIFSEIFPSHFNHYLSVDNNLFSTHTNAKGMDFNMMTRSIPKELQERYRSELNVDFSNYIGKGIKYRRFINTGKTNAFRLNEEAIASLRNKGKYHALFLNYATNFIGYTLILADSFLFVDTEIPVDGTQTHLYQLYTGFHNYKMLYL